MDDSDSHSHFIPAAGHDRLLPLYDPLNWLLRTDRHRAWLVDTAAIHAGERVLDLGCGTGALSLALKARHPEAAVHALDPDPKALARARAKATDAGLSVAFEQGFADALPYPDASFDHVVSSLVLHHLEPAQKDAAFREVARVLAPGGALHVLDFGPPSGALSRALTHLLHRGESVGDQLAGRLPERMGRAGLVGVAELGRRTTPLGSLSLYAAQRAAEAQGAVPGGAPV
jgi:ubiquinone/menaquinone biosynthesis C-methylase UbiE